MMVLKTLWLSVIAPSATTFSPTLPIWVPVVLTTVYPTLPIWVPVVLTTVSPVCPILVPVVLTTTTFLVSPAGVTIFPIWVPVPEVLIFKMLLKTLWLSVIAPCGATVSPTCPT